MTTVATTTPQCLRGIGSRRETARFRIYFFHHAAGSASSYLWGKHFPDEFEICAVQLPGRESRYLQAPMTTVRAAIAELVPALRSTMDLPYAFFGHSMGALVAFTVTRRLRSEGAPLPRHLFVSALRAPHLPHREPMHTLPNDELMAKVADSRLTNLKPETREMCLPVLRADLKLCETYRYEVDAALPCPITVFGGHGDQFVDEPELREWGVHTSAGFDLEMFPGGHFYLRGAERLLAEQLRRRLAAH